MLTFIFKNKFIQGLRRYGYSKKQAGRIYERFIENRMNDGGRLSSIIDYAVGCSKKDSPINYHLISGAFSWSETPQGHNYWRSINEKLRGDK